MPKPIGKKGLTKKLDSMWSRVVKIQAGNKCEVCGLEGDNCRLNSHHIVGRRNYRLRWELYNGVCLCSGCHTFRTLSAHQNPLWFESWLKENRGEDLKLLRTTMNEIKKWSMDDMLDLRKEFEESLN